MAKTLELILLVVSAILVVVGTAVLWNARSDFITATILADTDEAKSQYNWDIIVFWLVFLACAGAVLQPKARVWVVLAAGMLLLLAMYRAKTYSAWALINACRIAQADSATAADWNKKCSSGGIIAYFGILLAILLAFFSEGSMAEAQKGFKGNDKLLSLVSAIFATIGVIVLWSSKAATVSFTSFAYYSRTIDTTVVTILATLYVIGGTFNGNTVLRAAGGFVSALVFVFVFHDMFDGAKGVADDNQQYAGYLFCWFAMWANMGVVALQHWKTA